MSGGSPTTALLCPRCRYDQSGEIARWHHECPLRGCCPECGLAFEWVDLLSEVRPPPWWIGANHQRLSYQVLGTTVRSVLPWVLWRRVRMEHGGRAMPLLLTLALTLVVCHVSEFTTAAAFMLPSVTSQPSWKWWEVFSPDAIVSPFGRWNRADVRWLILFSGVGAVSFVVLPETRRRARVAVDHVVRVAIVVTTGALLLYSVFLWTASAVMVIGALRANPRTWPWAVPGEYWWGFATANAGWAAAGFWIALGWLFACNRYLRLDRGGVVAASITAIAILTTLVISVMTWLINVYGWRSAFFDWR